MRFRGYFLGILTSIGIGKDCARLLRIDGRTGIETEACLEEQALPSTIPAAKNRISAQQLYTRKKSLL